MAKSYLAFNIIIISSSLQEAKPSCYSCIATHLSLLLGHCSHLSLLIPLSCNYFSSSCIFSLHLFGLDYSQLQKQKNKKMESFFNNLIKHEKLICICLYYVSTLSFPYVQFFTPRKLHGYTFLRRTIVYFSHQKKNEKQWN